MGFESLAKRLAAGPESGRQFILGRVVRMDSDEDVSKTGTVSVMTFDGTLYRDVLLTYDSRYVRHFPDTPFNDKNLGSLVIIGFLNANNLRPFILKYIHDTTLPVPQEPKNFVSWSNGDFQFASDGYGNTSVLFENVAQSLSLTMPLESANFSFTSNGTSKYFVREMKFETRTFAVDTVELSLKSDSLSQTGTNLSFNARESYTIEAKSFSLKVSDEASEEFEKLKQKISELESEVTSLKLKCKELELKSDSSLSVESSQLKLKSTDFTVDSKFIKLGGTSPTDAPVLFNQFQALMQQLCAALSTLTVVCSAPGSPSSPPANLAVFQSIAASLSSLQSKFIKIE